MLRFGLTSWKRIIPAGAGNSAVRFTEATGGVGSSPQARGTPCVIVRSPPFRRIIPAGAGNSASTTAPAGTTRDHPRRRGELTGSIVCLPSVSGSSPQARGTRWADHSGHWWLRIIPAGAGNSSRIPLPTPRVTDHPRRRGELSPPRLSAYPRAGSSPQARGTLFCLCPSGRPFRIIPAGAGNSSSFGNANPSSSDHPRRRGELNFRTAMSPASAGSSPQARGTRVR